MISHELGKSSESAAADYLVARGYRIVERNVRFRSGEIDVVAMDGECLVLVEVKARSRRVGISPFEAVNYRKQSKLRALAEIYLSGRAPRHSGVRFDVISVVGGTTDCCIEHLIDAF